MRDVTSQLAMPGDPDLDCDVNGLVVTAVIANKDTREIMIRAEGGQGQWVDADGNHTEVDNITDLDMTARFPDMADQVWADYTAILYRWRDDGTTLRMTCAPERITLLIETRDVFLPFPRRPDPRSETAR